MLPNGNMEIIFIVRVAHAEKTWNAARNIRAEKKLENPSRSLELATAVDLALEKGSEPAMGNKIDNVVVILNPMANGGFAVQAYEENAKPIFDCAGFDLTVRKTGETPCSIPNLFYQNI